MFVPFVSMVRCLSVRRRWFRVWYRDPNSVVGDTLRLVVPILL